MSMDSMELDKSLTANAVKDFKLKEAEKNRKYFMISLIAVIIFITFWWLATDVFKFFPTYALPSPVTVLKGFIFKLNHTAPDNGTIFQHILASLKVAFSGYILGAVIGIPLGIMMAWNRIFDLIVTPLFDLIRPVPTIAWIPLMIIWFGIGLQAKAAIVFMSAFTPMVINSYSGIKSTKNVHLWVAETFGASRMHMLWTVAIPSALPQIFTGLRISLGSSWTALAAAEMLAASQGLGFMIQLNRQLARPDLIIVGMLTIGAMGAFLSKLLTLLEKQVVKGMNVNG